MTNRPQSPPDSPLVYRLPAAVLRLWSKLEGEEPSIAEAELFRLTRGHRGFHRIAPGTLAITAEAGDPAVFDTALFVAQQLLLTLGQQVPDLRLLLLPGEVTLRGDSAEAQIDLLLERAPAWLHHLQPGTVHLTGWVRGMLEHPHDAREVSVESTSAERQTPLFRIGERQAELRPWRNAKILNRPIRAVARPQLLTAARELLDTAAWRIEGPVGCGKTHFAHQLLMKARAPRVWVRGQPRHRSARGLARQIVQQLQAMQAADSASPLSPGISDPEVLATLSRLVSRPPGPGQEPDSAKRLAHTLRALVAAAEQPFYLVFDDVEQSSPEELQTVAELLSMPEMGRDLRLLLIGRTSMDLPRELAALPRFEVGPFSDQEMNEFSSQLFTGLSLPEATRHRLYAATQGYPLALEEGMIALIREKSLRRVYGSFFFAGQDSTGFSPSPRLLCHLQAEVFRLGIETPMHLLSLVDTAAPAPFVTEAARQLVPEFPHRWDELGRSSGLLSVADSPWGPGVSFVCPAFASTLTEGLDPSILPDLRVTLGTTISRQSQSGKALWEAYRLLRGTTPAIECLFQALATPYAARIPQTILLDVLTQELYRHRERQGEAEIELELLWKLLPLARKLGRLNEFTSDLERGVELARSQPRRLLALAGLKAEMDQDAGRYGEAESTIRLALEAAKGADERRQGLLLIQLGRLQLDRERYEEAKELFQKLAQSLDGKGLEALSASCRYYLGNIAFHEEEYEEALELHREALEQRRALNLQRVVGNSLTAMGAVYMALGNFPQALHCYREAQQLLEDHGGEADRAFPLLGLGRALHHLGDFTAASQPLRQALALRQGKDDIAGEAVARLAVAENHLLLGQLEKAQDEGTKALFQLNLLARKTLRADAEQLLGRIQMRLRRFDSARRHFQTAAELHREMDNRQSTAFDLAYLVDLAVIMEDADEAARLTQALEDALGALARPELEEQLHFHLFRGVSWLRDRSRTAADPLPFLERAYRELLRKASHLAPEHRHQFLFQIADYREIIEAAARAGLSMDSQ